MDPVGPSQVLGLLVLAWDIYCVWDPPTGDRVCAIILRHWHWLDIDREVGSLPRWRILTYCFACNWRGRPYITTGFSPGRGPPGEDAEEAMERAKVYLRHAMRLLAASEYPQRADLREFLEHLE